MSTRYAYGIARRTPGVHPGLRGSHSKFMRRGRISALGRPSFDPLRCGSICNRLGLLVQRFISFMLQTRSAVVARVQLFVMVAGLTATTPVVAIMAGAPPDTPAIRVDPNTTASIWSGVGSLAIKGDTYNA